MTLGERIGYYRVRRDMSQRALAEMVGRTENWLQKVETGRILLDRLSVIRALADVLDVGLADLLGEPSLLNWSADSGQQTVTAIRAALTDYRQLVPFDTSNTGNIGDAAVDLDALDREILHLWDLYQRSRYGALAKRLPYAISEAIDATRSHISGTARARANRAYAYTHQVATLLLTKLGEADLGWLAASRGLDAARATEDPVVVGSLLRNAVHALSTDGEYQQATQLAAQASDYLAPEIGNQAAPDRLSVYGCLHLIAALAAAHTNNHDLAAEHLAEADRAATRLGGDANHVWSAFGPTNVAIHNVSVSVELDDISSALQLGPTLNTRGLPVERRVRHLIEVARAFERARRLDDAIDSLIKAEKLAPEQVHHHRLSRLLVMTMVRRNRPSRQTVGLAHRMGLLAPTRT